MKVYASLVKSENLAVWGLLLGLSREGTPMGQDEGSAAWPQCPPLLPLTRGGLLGLCHLQPPTGASAPVAL